MYIGRILVLVIACVTLTLNGCGKPDSAKPDKGETVSPVTDMEIKPHNEDGTEK